MGATNSTRKLTIDSIALLEMLEPNAAEVQAKARVRERIQAILAKEWPTCRVLPFGSSESGLGFGGSDLDLGLYFDDVELEYQHHFTASERLQILSTVCTRLAGDFEIREFVQHARVPVVKLWDPHNQVACDVCVGSVHVLLNTALLKHCARSDPRVRPLAFAVKYWAKQRGINDSVNGTLSSYAFMLLLIFFLQSSRAQSLLPSVASVFHSIQTERTLSAVCHRLDSLSASAQSDSTFGSTEHESVGALLCGFFRFYACDFNVDGDVVSVRTGLPLAKASKWSRTPPWRISIEDPFEISHDVGRVVFNRIGQELLHKEFRRAYEMAMGGHRLEAICARDETMWSCHATCYVCSSTTHTPRECSQAIVRADGSTVAIGGRVNATRSMGDCWYCGGTGHVKATCPLYAYVAVPNPTSVVPPSMAAVAPATAISSPIAISVKNVHANAVWPAAVLEHSPVRAGKKKKRPRRGSISSIASSPEQEHARKYMLAAGRQLSRKCGNTPRRHHGTATVPSVPCMT